MKFIAFVFAGLTVLFTGGALSTLRGTNSAEPFVFYLGLFLPAAVFAAISMFCFRKIKS